jgi:hypothetical protein
LYEGRARVGTVVDGVCRRGYDAPVEAFERTSDARKVVVFVTVGACDSIDGVDVEEIAAGVLITVKANAAPTCRTIAPAGLQAEVRLPRPLRDRPIINRLGAKVPERPPSAGAR